MMGKILMELCEIRKQLQLSKEVFTLKEFCLYADLSEEHAYRLTSSGKLKFFRPFGKRIYIRKEDAIKALTQNPVGTGQDIERSSVSNFFNNQKAA